MGVYLSLTSNKRDSEPLKIMDDLSSSTGLLVESGVDWGSVLNPGIYASSIDTEGASKVGARLEPRTITLPILCGTGDTLQSVQDAWSALEAMIYEVNEYKGVLRFRSHKLTYAVSFEVEHIDIANPWSKSAELGGYRRPVLTLTCRPFALMDAMDIVDEFTDDTFGTDGKYNNAGSDWTADAGALTNVSVTGGVLDAAANLSTENRFIHTGTPYTVSDCETIISFTPGGTTSSFKAGCIIKRIDANNYLEAYIDDNGVNSRIRIDKIVAGVRTNLSSTNLTARISSSVRVWIAGRVERNVVWAHVFTATNFKNGYKPVSASDNDVSVTLSTSEADTFGQTIQGRQGIVFTPQHTDAKIHDYQTFCYTYRANANRYHPDHNVIQDGIPGKAPALLDIEVSDQSSGSQCLVAWGKRPEAVNWCWNPGFDSDGSNGWSVSAATGFNSAGTSITATSSTDALDGANVGVLVTTATSGSGCNFAIFRNLRKGVTYTANVCMRAPSSTTSMTIKFGSDGGSATSSASALTTSWQVYTVSYTPTSESSSVAYLSIQTNAATVTTAHIDRVLISEDDYVPSAEAPENAIDTYPGGFTQLERIHAGNMYAKTGSYTLSTDTSAFFDKVVTPGASGLVLQVPMIFDNQNSDESDTVTLKVYARIKLSSGTTTAALIPRIVTTATDEFYSLEYSTTGVSVIGSKPSSSTVSVNVFAGTISFPASAKNRQLAYFSCQLDYTGTAPELEHFVFIPANRHASTIHKLSGAAADLPEFCQFGNATSYRSDGSTWREHYYLTGGFMRSVVRIGAGLLGSMPRLDAGSQAQVYVMPSNFSVSHSTPASSDGATSEGHLVTIRHKIRPRVLMVGE